MNPEKKDTSMPYVCLYASYLQALTPFTDEERGRLVTAMLAYMTLGEDTEFQGPERYLWPQLRSQIDRDREAYIKRCEANRRNGAKGGRPRKNTSGKTEGFSKKPKKPKEKEKEKKKEKKNQKENEKDNYRERDIENTPVSAPVTEGPMQIPTTMEIYAYCQEEDLEVDPFRFRDYYQALGWRLGNNPIRDWRPLLHRWAENQLPAYDMTG